MAQGLSAKIIEAIRDPGEHFRDPATTLRSESSRLSADNATITPEEMVSVLNRSTHRLASAAAVGALGIAIALGTTACGSGEISQTANQEPAVNGASGTIVLSPSDFNGEEMQNGVIAIRNAHVIYPVAKADKIFGDGGPFKIAFNVANDSPTRVITLDSITTPTGNIKIGTANNGKINPSQGLLAGETAIADTATDAERAAATTRLDVELTNAGTTVAAGLTIPLTFNFTVYDLAGKTKVESVSTTIATPVDAGPNLDRQDEVRDISGH